MEILWGQKTILEIWFALCSVWLVEHCFFLFRLDGSITPARKKTQQKRATRHFQFQFWCSCIGGLAVPPRNHTDVSARLRGPEKNRSIFRLWGSWVLSDSSMLQITCSGQMLGSCGHSEWILDSLTVRLPPSLFYAGKWPKFLCQLWHLGPHKTLGYFGTGMELTVRDLETWRGLGLLNPCLELINWFVFSLRSLSRLSVRNSFPCRM